MKPPPPDWSYYLAIVGVVALSCFVTAVVTVFGREWIAAWRERRRRW